MVELRVRSKFLVLGQIALGMIAVFAALVLFAGPSGSARAPGIAAGVLVLVVAVWLLRGLRRQAVVLDGDRVGWRGGPTGRVVGWTALDDVHAVSVARMSSTLTRTHPDVILWAKAGGLRGVRALLLRPQMPRQLAADGHRPPLHPFIVPFSALSDGDRATMHTLLAERGLIAP